MIRRDNIGDLVCTTPLIAALRQRYPQARLCALVNSYTISVLQGNPDLDEVYAYTKLKHRAPGISRFRVALNRLLLLWALRRQRFDCAILVGAHFLPRALRLARVIRPRHILGFTEPGKPGVQAIDIGIPYTSPHPMHEVEDIFRLLAPLGITGAPPRMRIYPDAAELESAQQVFRQTFRREAGSTRMVVGVHISARENKNRWPVDNFIELIRNAHAKLDFAFVLFWSPGDKSNPFYPGDDDKAQAVRAALPGVPLALFPTQSVQRLIAGLAACDVVIGCDGGAVHLAAALGKPVLGLYGEKFVTHWYPWGVPHVALSAKIVPDIPLAEALAGLQRLLAGVSPPVANEVRAR